MRKATSPRSDVSRIAPSSQEIRRRNNPVKSWGAPTRQSGKQHLPRLLTELAIARADGRYAKLLTSLAKTSVLVIDDWGVSKLSAENRRDLLEIIEDRHGLSSTIVTSQLPVKSWHEVIGDPTLADAILDRLVHNAYQLNLKGESMRKARGPLNQTDRFTP